MRVTVNLFGEMMMSAVMSGCGRYRYSLLRQWDPAKPRVCFVMLNPSTADAECDDPTIRRCLGFARLWECGSLSVVNLFALRATNPADLIFAGADAFGEDNDEYIDREARAADLVVAAWGAHARAEIRAWPVRSILRRPGMLRPRCLGLTRDGHPRHPLYVPANQSLMDLPHHE